MVYVHIVGLCTVHTISNGSNFVCKIPNFQLIHSVFQINLQDDVTSFFLVDCHSLVTTDVGDRGGYVNQKEKKIVLWWTITSVYMLGDRKDWITCTSGLVPVSSHLFRSGYILSVPAVGYDIVCNMRSFGWSNGSLKFFLKLRILLFVPSTLCN